MRGDAYIDAPLAIGYGQTITQPYMTALMAQLLELTGDEKVLDVGTGSGYHAAVLGALARSRDFDRADSGAGGMARAKLEAHRTRFEHHSRCAATDRWAFPEEAPFDAISVAAGSPDIPPALLAQLNDPGILVIPVGGRDDQNLRVIRKHNGKIADARHVGLPLRASGGSRRLARNRMNDNTGVVSRRDAGAGVSRGRYDRGSFRAGLVRNR